MSDEQQVTSQGFELIDAVNTLMEQPSAETEPATEIKAEENAPVEAVDASIDDTKAEAQEEPKQAPEDEKPAEPAKKTIAVKWGETEAEAAAVPPEALIEVTIDGQPQQVSLQELRNNYSGKAVWDRKFSELDKERKTYLADKTATEEQIETFVSKLKTDFFDAAAYIAELSGADPIEYVSDLRSKLYEQFAPIGALDEEARAIERIKQDNEFFKRYSKSKKEAAAQEQARLALESQALHLRETLGITDEEISWAEAELKSRPFEYKEFLNGRTPTKMEAIELADATRRYTTAVNALALIDPSLSQIESFAQQGMIELAEHRSATPEQAAQLFLQKYPWLQKHVSTPTAPAPVVEEPKKSAIERKIEKNAKLSGAGKDEKTTESPDGEEILSFHDFYQRLRF